MACTARKKSNTGIYHVIILGIGKQNGLPTRQIERITVINRGIIQKA